MEQPSPVVSAIEETEKLSPQSRERAKVLIIRALKFLQEFQN